MDNLIVAGTFAAWAFGAYYVLLLVSVLLNTYFSIRNAQTLKDKLNDWAVGFTAQLDKDKAKKPMGFDIEGLSR